MYYKTEKSWDELPLSELAYKEEFAEDSDTGYTKQELIDICKGDTHTAKILFETLSWQSPFTVIDEWDREGEIDENCKLIK